MIKELDICTINDRPAVFRASVEKRLFKTYPVATLTFDDGYVIKCTYDILKGETSYSDKFTPAIIYKNGQWEFA